MKNLISTILLYSTIFCLTQCSHKENSFPLDGTIYMYNNFPDYKNMKYRLIQEEPLKYYYKHCNGCKEIDSTLWDNILLQRKHYPYHNFKYNPLACPYGGKAPMEHDSYLITSARKYNDSDIIWIFKITPKTKDTTIVISPETACKTQSYQIYAPK
ncbi:MAG: hypothetical protein HY738_14635 [Bacteroidia bacterium]|nr:hypothetical protein [Bacteroidia bacterium]